MTDNSVHVLSDPDAVAGAVADRLLALLEKVQAERGTAHVVLTGGTIADLVHRAVARRSAESKVAWDQVVFWWGDERIVGASSEDRNEVQARRAFLDHVPVPEANIRAIPSSDVGSVEEAAEHYAAAVHEAPDLFDLVMLGIGPDGHVASLFPGFPQLRATGAAVSVTDSPKPPPLRVTLTFDRLNATRQTWLMASGSGKAEAVAAASRPGAVEEIPARGVRAHEEVHWFLDADAAARR